LVLKVVEIKVLIASIFSETIKNNQKMIDRRKTFAPRSKKQNKAALIKAALQVQPLEQTLLEALQVKACQVLG
jgi:hypothetical protein